MEAAHIITVPIVPINQIQEIRCRGLVMLVVGLEESRPAILNLLKQYPPESEESLRLNKLLTYVSLFTAEPARAKELEQQRLRVLRRLYGSDDF
jgi:hypothetical protein